MNNEEKINVLVLGASGAGKSTLIKAVSGAKIITGGCEGKTEKIDVYDSDTWPLKFIDTKGFEYSYFAQRKTIKQVKQYTSEQLKAEDKKNAADSVGIDVVWYCVEGTARRTFSHNIELMSKAIKGWKNVPVFAVITKSYSESDISENIQAVANSFANVKKVNLQKTLPVVAEEYRINDEVSVAPFGIAELCSATIDCADAAKRINEDNRIRMILEQKRFTANVLVGTAATSAAVIGAVPIGFKDAVILVPLETAMTKGIFKVYNVEFSNDLVSAIIGSAVITNIAKTAVEPLRALPIAGSVVNGAVAGAVVLALGEAVIATAQAIHTDKIDPNKLDDIMKSIESKLEESKLVGNLIGFMNDNIKDLKGKNAKEIIAAFLDFVKNNVK